MQPTEHIEQTYFFQWCLRHSEEYEGLNSIFAIPNGGKRDAISGKRLKDEGVRAGVPDLFLPVRRGGYGGLFVEMKTREKGVLSSFQKAWRDTLLKAGYQWVCAKGFKEAKEYVEQYYSA